MALERKQGGESESVVIDCCMFAFQYIWREDGEGQDSVWVGYCIDSVMKWIWAV